MIALLGRFCSIGAVAVSLALYCHALNTAYFPCMSVVCAGLCVCVCVRACAHVILFTLCDLQLRYDLEEERVVAEPVELAQEFRRFDFNHSWEQFPLHRQHGPPPSVEAESTSKPEEKK